MAELCQISHMPTRKNYPGGIRVRESGGKVNFPAVTVSCLTSVSCPPPTKETRTIACTHARMHTGLLTPNCLKAFFLKLLLSHAHKKEVIHIYMQPCAHCSMRSFSPLHNRSIMILFRSVELEVSQRKVSIKKKTE